MKPLLLLLLLFVGVGFGIWYLNYERSTALDQVMQKMYEAPPPPSDNTDS